MEWDVVDRRMVRALGLKGLRGLNRDMEEEGMDGVFMEDFGVVLVPFVSSLFVWVG